MIKNVRFFDFCRIELVGILPVKNHTFEEINSDKPGSTPLDLLSRNDYLRKVTYAARHQNKSINMFNFDFIFSIYLNSTFNIVSVDVDTAKMINDHEESARDNFNKGKDSCQESILSVMTRYLLRSHLSLSLILPHLEKAVSDATIPFSLKVERDYLDSSYVNGRIISPIKMFYSVIDLIIDDQERLKKFISSMNYENLNDVLIFIMHTKNDEFKENISYEKEEISLVLNDAIEKTEKIGFEKLIEKLTSISKDIFPQNIINLSLEKDLILLEEKNCDS